MLTTHMLYTAMLCRACSQKNCTYDKLLQATMRIFLKKCTWRHAVILTANVLFLSIVFFSL